MTLSPLEQDDTRPPQRVIFVEEHQQITPGEYKHLQTRPDHHGFLLHQLTPYSYRHVPELFPPINTTSDMLGEHGEVFFRSQEHPATKDLFTALPPPAFFIRMMRFFMSDDITQFWNVHHYDGLPHYHLTQSYTLGEFPVVSADALRRMDADFTNVTESGEDHDFFDYAAIEEPFHDIAAMYQQMQSAIHHACQQDVDGMIYGRFLMQSEIPVASEPDAAFTQPGILWRMKSILKR